MRESIKNIGLILAIVVAGISLPTSIISIMNELFYEWLDACPAQWLRLEVIESESSYVFYDEAEDDFEADSRGMGI